MTPQGLFPRREWPLFPAVKEVWMR